MDWSELGRILPPIITALAGAIAIPLALRKRKKEAPEKSGGLLSHLQEMGIKAVLLDKGAEQGKVGLGRGSGQRSESIIRVEGKNFDYINIISVTSQYGVNYYLDYLVKSGGGQSGMKRNKTRMVRKKGVGIGGRLSGIQWQGDEYLVRALNYDYQLEGMLVQANPKELKGGIQIFPESKHEYNRIRTGYFLPSAEFLGALHIIAGQVKSAW